jgi:hypothetical protein
MSRSAGCKYLAYKYLAYYERFVLVSGRTAVLGWRSFSDLRKAFIPTFSGNSALKAPAAQVRRGVLNVLGGALNVREDRLESFLGE